ncbi:MAG: heavy metal translocating P-type ATPase [Phycisphaerae bacterium]
MAERPGCHYCHLPVRIGKGPPPEGPVYCCYGCRLAGQITQARGEQGQVAWMLARLGMAMFLSMVVMVISLYLYGEQLALDGAFENQAKSTSSALTGLMRYASMVLATPVFFLLGVPILRNATEGRPHRIASTDALIFLAVSAALVYSYASTFREYGATYYETACMVLVLVTLGRWLEATGRLKASSAVGALERLIPSEVCIERDGRRQTVQPKDVQPGDRVLVNAGQTIAVDGVIAAGRAQVDERILTGESALVAKEVGDSVRVGSINTDGALSIEATAVGTETTLGRMIRLLRQAQAGGGRYERLADRVARAFVPAIVGLALLAAILGLNRGGLDEAIMSAMATLLIACPCALGIATPLACWIAMGRAAERGALFRHGESVEQLAGVKAVCFDKTGTLTDGQPFVSEWVTANGDSPPADRVLGMAWGLSSASDHALSRSIADYAGRTAASRPAVADVRAVPGLGLVGQIDGHRVALGNVKLMRENGLAMAEPLTRACDRFAQDGQGITCIGWDGAVYGVFSFSETLRAEAGATARALSAMGCQVCVLTGDHQARARAIAALLGVETFGELLPEDKVAHVRNLQRTVGPTAMVGDGVNDAAALAVADVGIAMGCGADVTRESADLCLLGDDLGVLPELVALARRTVRIMRANLAWAFGYNAIGMTLAVAGKLTPIVAAGAMVLSSLFVIGNSLRLGPPGLEAKP